MLFYSPPSLCPSLRAGPGPPTEVLRSDCRFGTSAPGPGASAASADSDRRRLPAVNLHAGHARAGSEFLRSAPGRPSLAEGARPGGPGAHRPLAA
jgi:hypothetical protein